MLSRTVLRPRRQNAPRPEWKVAAAYLQWLRGRPCACGGRNRSCGGDMQAAHVDGAGKGTTDAKGVGSKVSDRYAIPMSTTCHAMQHSKGWPWFIATILLRDPVKLAEEYWRAWPGRAKWESTYGR